MRRLSSWLGSKVSINARFRIMHGMLALLAGAAIAAAVSLALTSVGSSSGRTPGSGPGDGGSTPSPTATLSGFALELQDWADTAQASYGGPKVTVIDCIQGGPGDFFCAFIIKNECHASHVLIESGNITPTQSGRIGIPVAECSAANALHWIGQQGG